MKKLLLIFAALLLSYAMFVEQGGRHDAAGPAAVAGSAAGAGAGASVGRDSTSLDRSSADDPIGDAYRNRQSDVQVAGEGVVIKLLADDNDGSRHQRFIVRLASGQTLLIAHNIDLAPRIDALRVGDRIAFYGEYEWNDKGGVLHWTHHDPRGGHVGGWLEHAGQRYQ